MHSFRDLRNMTFNILGTFIRLSDSMFDSVGNGHDPGQARQAGEFLSGKHPSTPFSRKRTRYSIFSLLSLPSLHPRLTTSN